MHYDLRKHQQIKKMLLKYTKHNRNADKKKNPKKRPTMEVKKTENLCSWGKHYHDGTAA